jgi:hypothetical protein
MARQIDSISDLCISRDFVSSLRNLRRDLTAITRPFTSLCIFVAYSLEG